MRHRRPLTCFFELDPTLCTATGDTVIGSVLSLAGLQDITGPSVQAATTPSSPPRRCFGPT